VNKGNHKELKALRDKLDVIISDVDTWLQVWNLNDDQTSYLEGVTDALQSAQQAIDNLQEEE
jgi:hypothetical protein